MDRVIREISEKIRHMLDSNWICGKKEGHMFCYTQPSKGDYPHQFFWDSAFHAIIAIEMNETGRAIKELDTLFSAQREDGFIGHEIYWREKNIIDWYLSRYYKKCQKKYPPQSCIVQPPVIAHAIHRLWKRGYKKEAEKLAPYAVHFLEWIVGNRIVDNTGLVTIIHPWESGMDALPCYDLVLKPGHIETLSYLLTFPRLLKIANEREWNYKKLALSGKFRVKDVGYNTITAEAFILLAQVTGNNELREYGYKIKDSIEKYMWSKKDELYYSLGPDNMHLSIKTVASLLPLTLEISPDRAASLVEHLTNKEEFWANFPVPSVAMDEPKFNPNPSRILLWRGPTWIATNWFIVRGLLRHGYKREASIISRRSAALVRVHGLREQYNPITGSPGGAKNFGWSGLVIDMLLMIKNGERYEGRIC